MPPEWYAIDGARLSADLKARRDALADEAVKYHEHLAAVVDVRLTNKSERIEAARRANGDTEVTVRVARPGRASRGRRPSTGCSTRRRPTRSASTPTTGTTR